MGGPPASDVKPEGTLLSGPHSPNDLWCADYKGEFMLADRRYCYPLTITDFASCHRRLQCDPDRRSKSDPPGRGWWLSEPPLC
jgi:hypothetical protein